MESLVTGTLIWYYCICKREVWLMSRRIQPDQYDSNMEIGRFIHENAYRRERKEIDLGHAKLDIIRNEKGELVVGEVKKSSRFLKSAQMQLLFYLYQLKQMGITARGELLIPSEKKRVTIELNDSLEHEILGVMTDVESIALSAKPPPPVKVKWCRNCAYAEFCWA